MDEAGAATFTHLVDNIEMWQRSSGRNEVRYDSKTDDDVPPGYEEVAKSVGSAAVGRYDGPARHDPQAEGNPQGKRWAFPRR